MMRWIALFLSLWCATAYAQTYPSPTYQNVTVNGTAAMTGSGVGLAVTNAETVGGQLTVSTPALNSPGTSIAFGNNGDYLGRIGVGALGYFPGVNHEFTVPTLLTSNNQGIVLAAASNNIIITIGAQNMSLGNATNGAIFNVNDCTDQTGSGGCSAYVFATAQSETTFTGGGRSFGKISSQSAGTATYADMHVDCAAGTPGPGACFVNLVPNTAGIGVSVTAGAATAPNGLLITSQAACSPSCPNNADWVTFSPVALSDATAGFAFRPNAGGGMYIQGADTSGSTNIFQVSNSTPATLMKITDSGAIAFPQVTTGTNADFVCMSTGNVLTLQTSSCTISSLRFKNVLGHLPPEQGLADVMALQPIAFKMKDHATPNPDPNFDRPQIGLAAENVAAVDPRMAIYEDDLTTPKSYRQESVIATLVAAVQCQQWEIRGLMLAVVLLAAWSAGLTVVVVRR